MPTTYLTVKNIYIILVSSSSLLHTLNCTYLDIVYKVEPSNITPMFRAAINKPSSNSRNPSESFKGLERSIYSCAEKRQISRNNKKTKTSAKLTAGLIIAPILHLHLHTPSLSYAFSGYTARAASFLPF